VMLSQTPPGSRSGSPRGTSSHRSSMCSINSLSHSSLASSSSPAPQASPVHYTSSLPAPNDFRHSRLQVRHVTNMYAAVPSVADGSSCRQSARLGSGPKPVSPPAAARRPPVASKLVYTGYAPFQISRQILGEMAAFASAAFAVFR